MKEMTCRDFDEVVHGFVHMELLDVTVREAALEHAAHCALCAERMADATALAEASQAVGENARSDQAPPQIEAALLSAFRSHHRRRSWQRTLEWASIGAAAAVLLLFVWMGNGKQKAQSIPTPRKDVSSQSSAPMQAEIADPSKLVSLTSGPATNATEAVASPNESYLASDFIPVPYTGAIVADDPGMVVRVQLTRASLAQLGYPVAETPDEDLILADVLVGEDGWPRGVKLIQ
jgi:hypothetical protein